MALQLLNVCDFQAGGNGEKAESNFDEGNENETAQ